MAIIGAVMLRLTIARKAVPTPAGPRTVIEGAGFELRRGEIVALVGPSGSGKTTILRIVAGLDRAFDGSLDWPSGRPARIGTVFQEPLLLPWRTVGQNLVLVRPSLSAEALLTELGLPRVAGLYPAALSLGMARRVSLARALAVEPELLLLDEPFVSLDPAAAETARTVVLQRWRARPMTALLITHDLAEACALADRVLIMSGGAIREVEIPEARRRRGMGEGALIAAGLEQGGLTLPGAASAAYADGNTGSDAKCQ